MKRPNVIILYTDQQRWDTINCAGFEYMHTPNLDKLAAEGVLFNNAFCNNPVCMPSRQSMLSGQYPSTIGCSTNGIEMPLDVPVLPDILKSYGYVTGNMGKLHFKNHANRDHREPHPRYGFDELILSDEPGCYDDAYIKWIETKAPGMVDKCRTSTPPCYDGEAFNVHPRGTQHPYVFEGPEDLTHAAFVAEESCEFIKRHKDHPFFLISGFYAPHPPLNPPQRFVDMYDPEKMPLPIMNESEQSNLGISGRRWQLSKAYYYAMISHVDDQIKRIIKTLEEQGLKDDTLIIFTSDHGEHLGDHGHMQKGPPGMDSCIHVPLIISYPAKINEQGRCEDLVEAVDLAPTVLDYCGVQIPPFFQGQSLFSLLQEKNYSPRSSAFMEFKSPFEISWKTIRTKEFKYCASSKGEELLFDAGKKITIQLINTITIQIPLIFYNCSITVRSCCSK